MRDDLLDANAALDWAEAQIELLNKRLDKWKASKPYDIETIIANLDLSGPQKLFKVKQKVPLPLIVNAEVGSIINSVRSSFDLLATALAVRNGHKTVDNVYFPISSDVTNFLREGMKKIKRLSADDQDAIKALKPYSGGNDTLYAIHQLDIQRKHRRLVAVGSETRQFALVGSGAAPKFPTTWRRLEDEPVMAWVGADTANYKAYLTVEVFLAESLSLSRKPVVATLRDFMREARAIIGLFDPPPRVEVP